MNTPNNTKVLIVEDSHEYASMLRRMLGSRLGMSNVTIVSSCEAALEAVKKSPSDYEMLFVDYHFPTPMSGGQLMSALRNTGLLQDKVAFFMTAEPDVEKAIEATEYGLCGVVVKPFDSDQLAMQVERAMRDLEMARVSGD
jgi:DNA-binding NtrC family response regulator